jgi:putative redox protein
MSDSSLTASVNLLEGMTFLGSTGSGHDVVLDAAPEVGGRECGPRPMEMLLVGLGGCTGMDVISMLRKMRQPVSNYEIRLIGERADEHPKVFTTITVEHVVRGRGVSPEAVRRAVELSATRYCSAAAMLGRAAHIEETFRVIDETSGQTYLQSLHGGPSREPLEAVGVSPTG